MPLPQGYTLTTPQAAPPAPSGGGLPPGYTLTPPPAPESPSVSGFFSNALSSGAKFVGNTVHAVEHPVDTLNAVGDTIEGAGNQYVPGYSALKQATGATPETMAHQNATVDAFKKNLKDRYGSLDNFGHTLYHDPVGVAADISALAGGVSGVARGVGLVADAADAAGVASGAARVAKVANTVSDATNPVALATKAGGAVVDAAKAGAGKAGEAADATRNAGAAALDQGAEKNIATLLNPTTKVNKALVQNKIAPVLAGTKPLIEGEAPEATRASSLQDLQNQAQGHMETHGQTIDDIFDQHAEAGTKMSPKPLLAAVDAEKQNYIVDGVPINAPYVSKLTAIQNQIQAVSDANGGDIPLNSLRRIRQIHDDVVAQSKGGFALDPDAQSAVNASKVTGNAIRSSFADGVPELTGPNQKFSFWADVDKVTGDSLLRKTGQKAPLTQKLAGAVGAGVGAYLGHALGGELGGSAGIFMGKSLGEKVGAFSNSTMWNTLAAATKSKISNYLETGDDAAALALAKANGVVPVAAPATSAAPANVPTSGEPNVGNASEVQAVRAADGAAHEAPGGGQSPAGQPQAAASGAGPAAAGVGNRTAVSVPGKPGPGYPAAYKLQELDAVNGSHNGLTFAPNAGYKLTNDRNYANAANQGKVVNWSSPSEFDPAYHVTDNPDATNGPLVTDSGGNVIGGNGRAMILQRVYNGNPKGAAAYRAALQSKAAQFGIDPAQVAAMKQPVLTRQIDDSAFTAPGAKQDAVTDLNKTGTAALTPAERALSDARRVSPATLDDVAARLDAKGADATLADALEGKSGNQVMDKLIADGVISPQERAALGDANGLNKAGRDRVSQLVVGRFFRDPAQLDSAAPLVRAKMERIAAPLAQVEAKGGEWNLTPEVKSAVDLLDRARTAGVANVDDFLAQDGLFGKDKYTPEAVTIAKALKTSKSAEVTAAARQYAQDAAYADKGQTLMGDAPTPEKAFADSFGALKSGAQSDAAKALAKLGKP